MPRRYVDKDVKGRILAIWPGASKFKAGIEWMIGSSGDNVKPKQYDGVACAFSVEFDSGDLLPVKLADLQTVADCFGSDEVAISVDSIFEGQRYSPSTVTLLISVTHCTRGWH